MSIAQPTYPITTSALVAHIGTYADTKVDGADARLSDARTPIAGSVVDASVSATAAIAESKLALASDAAAGTASRRTLGTGATQAAAGNDARLSDTRTPTDATVTEAKLASALKGLVECVLTNNGSSWVDATGTTHASRPTGFGSVHWIGPDPGALAANNDTWTPTS